MQQSELDGVISLDIINIHTFRASPVARRTVTSSVLAATEFLGISIPCNTIRNIRETLHAVRVRL